MSTDSFIEELDKLLVDGMDREKLSEKDLDKARFQLKKRRQKEAKKKQRKRETTKKQKTTKGTVILPSDIAALAASGYALEPNDGSAEHHSLLLPPLTHALHEQHGLLSADQHGHSHAHGHLHQGHDPDDLEHDEDEDHDEDDDEDRNNGNENGPDSPSEENRVIAH